MRLMLFNRSLGVGGAERQLVTLACAMQARGLPVAVTVLYGGPLRADLDAAGVTVFDLGKTGRWDVLVLVRLVRALRAWRPDALYCFGGAMLFAVLIRPFLAGAALVWGVRASNLDYAFVGRLPRLLMRLDPLLARFADLIICNSEAGRRHMAARGLPLSRMVVQPNGINTDRWRFSAASRQALRAEWGIGPDERAVGIVGRLDPIKDHETFLRAAALCSARLPGLRFVIVGGGDPALEARLKGLARQILPQGVIWTGNFKDMAAAYSALDLLVQTSLSEGFPNVLGEGMACGLPVVATDAGDSRIILGPFGEVTAISDPAATAEAVVTVLARGNAPGREQVRAHIVANFGLEAMVDRSCALIRAAITQKGSHHA